jgi:hypothetical protein
LKAMKKRYKKLIRNSDHITETHSLEMSR